MHDQPYGPLSHRTDVPEFTWAVKRQYAMKPSERYLFSGMLTLFYRKHPWMDIEVQYVKGEKGAFVSFPQRPWGLGKYKKLLQIHDHRLAEMAAEACRLWLEVEAKRMRDEERLAALPAEASA